MNAPTMQQRAALARDHKKRHAKFIVRDAKSREDFRCNSEQAAREKFEQLTSNGRHAYVSPPLPFKQDAQA